MRELRKGSYREVPQEYYGSPKEVWGFRTDPDRRAARKIAEDFLRENHRLFKLEKNLDTLHFRKTIRSLGAQHVIFQQRWRKLWIHRAYVTVHLDNEGSVYMAKNRAMPKAMMPNPNRISFKVGPRAARRRALKEFRAAERRVSLLGREKLPRMETLLLPRKDKLYPAYRFRIYLKDPRQEWIVYVNGRTGRLVTKYDNLAHVNGRGSVFDPNPVVELGDYRLLLPADRRSPIEPRAEAYRIVTLRGLKKTGFLDGRYVTTDPTSWRVKHPNREFCFKSRQRGFAEVMAYYHIDTAARYLEALGFCGSRAILKGALAVDAYGTPKDNSWYSPGWKRLVYGRGGVPDAEDGETILHEFGHALQDAICPDFGQSKQAAAMGEGFGDYFPASMFAHKKVDNYRPWVMTWDGVTNCPPYIRRVDEDVTFDDFDTAADEHTNGKIWSATLWDIWEALGREKADTLIIESHFQLDGFTTFDRGARAILDADQNLYGGRYRCRLLHIFRGQRIGPLTRWD